MAYVITDTCIACGACKPECLIDCIAEGATYEIDRNAYVDCGSCARICPAGAAQPE